MRKQPFDYRDAIAVAAGLAIGLALVPFAIEAVLTAFSD
jgi:hypothetical protein